MKKSTESEMLKEAIQLLKEKQAFELVQLKDQYHVTYESLQPVNLIKNAFGQLTKTSEFKGNILNSVIGIASGYLSKKVLLGSSHNPITKVLGTILQFAITNFVSKKAETFTQDKHS
ncbi:hypothetical protein IQ05_01044 [Flavobacterium tiangeerense]|uniref:EcsC family protein n=1 Tax=Flavobacterium tiangeerense TaxID=459471 RepID=A0ABY3FKU5_9FLAO|nr:hypothetical protein [Flavobacterium tiangeerense]TWI00398.1 hypothetical protein IQ05_01044 [Flavobacterium tiangeerense]